MYALPKAGIQITPFPGPTFEYVFTREQTSSQVATWTSNTTPTVTTITSPVDYTANYNTGPYRGLVTGVDGKLYSPPWAAQGGILVIDPTANTATIESFGMPGNLTLNGGNFASGCLAPNGKIYCPPHNANTILIIDTVNGTATTSKMGSSYLIVGAATAFSSAVLAPNGKIYCPGRNTCLIIDPATETATTTTFGSLLNQSKFDVPFVWGSGVRSLANDKLYFCQSQEVSSTSINTSLLCIDTTNNTATVTTIGTAMTQGMTYFGISNGPSNLLYLSPYGSTSTAYGTPRQYWTVVNPQSNTSVDYVVGTDGTSNMSMGAILGDDGAVYAVPYFFGSKFQVFRSGSASQQTYGITPHSQARWWGGCLASNGKIYSLPDMGTFDADTYPLGNKILVLNVGGTGRTFPGFRDLIKESYFNKGGT